MGIQGALYSGVSGMSVNSTSMEVIGNNIANSNTYGYKSSRTLFADALSSEVSSSSGQSQVGSGALLSSVDSLFGQGSFESTSSATDLAIKGDSFFVVRDPNIDDNKTFTRSGAFRVQDGNLTNPEGYIVQGYEYNYDATGDPVVNDMQSTFGDIELEIGQDHPDTTSTATLESVSVDSDGVVTGKYTDGSLADLFCVQIAKFDNPSGLTKLGSSMFSESRSSGDAILGVTGGPGTAGGVNELGGTIYSSTLEMSNVDLAQEFVKMITTQRGFQANSKIITTTDELLNEVINLKR